MVLLAKSTRLHLLPLLVWGPAPVMILTHAWPLSATVLRSAQSIHWLSLLIDARLFC